MIRFFVVVFFWVSVVVGAVEPELDTFLQMGLPLYRPVALVDDILSIGVNPAGLGRHEGYSALGYAAGLNRSGIGEWGTYSALGPLGVGFETIRLSGNSFYKYTAALGAGQENLSVGAELHWFESQGGANTFRSWTVSALLRPSRFISIGLAMHDINRPDFMGGSLLQTGVFGISVRPFGEWMTASIEAQMRERHAVGPFEYTGSMASLFMEPVNGVHFRGSYRNDGWFGVALGLNWSHNAYYLETQTPALPDRPSPIGAVITYSNARMRTVLPGWTQAGLPQPPPFIPAVVEPPRTLEFTIEGDILDERTAPAQYATNQNTTKELVLALRRAQIDPYIKVVLLRVGPMRIGFGKLQELRSAIQELAKDKQVVAYLDGTTETVPYYLATAAPTILMAKTAKVEFSGLRTQVYFYKDLLQKIGVTVEVAKAGKYKAAIEPVTQMQMSPEFRENVNSLLDDWFGQMVKDIATARRRTQDQVKGYVDQAFFKPDQAVQVNLVDRVIDPILDPRDYAKERETALLTQDEFEERIYKHYNWKPMKIAFLPITGTIVSGRTGLDFMGGGIMTGSWTTIQALRIASTDPSIDAIIVRVDSPGGSADASEEIWQAIRKVKGKKPLIISLGDVAASGGYYVATAGDVIVAEEGSLTGSIGVFTQKYMLKGLFDMVGVNKEIIKRGKYADFGTEHRPFNEEESKILNDQIQDIYQQFIERVAIGRNLDKDQVVKMAEGRVYTAREAKEAKLVDHLGGLAYCIRLAREKTGLAADIPVKLVTIPNFWGESPLTSIIEIFAPSTMPVRMEGLEPLRDIGQALSLMGLGLSQRALYLMPFSLSLY